MSQPEIEITLSKNGKVKVVVRNSGGKKCLDLAEAIRQIIGVQESRTLTPEYYNSGDVHMDAGVRGNVTS